MKSLSLSLPAQLVLLLAASTSAPQAMAQTREASTMNSAYNTLNELVAIPNRSIPRSLLARAEGLVIIPGMLKVGFIGGVRRGRGIVVIRDENRSWKPPLFATMTGGSIGWQAGVQATDIVLVFMTRRSVNGLLSGKFTIGADAAAAAGPVGRQAAAATDGRLQAEILSYSRSRGLFAGVSVDGSVLQIDHAANRNFYGTAGLGPDGTPLAANAQLPPAAAQLLAALATHTDGTVAAPSLPGAAEGGTPGSLGSPSSSVLPGTGFQPSTPSPGVPGQPAAGSGWGTGTAAGAAPPVGSAASPTANRGGSGPLALEPPPSTAPARGGEQVVDDLETTRQSIVEAATRLGQLLDESWRLYLALPEELFTNVARPSGDRLDTVLERFARVEQDARYRLLSERQEFQRLKQLLQVYRQQLQAAAGR